GYGFGPAFALAFGSRRQDSMSSVWVHEQIGRSPYTVASALGRMTDPLVDAHMWEPLLRGQWSCRVKAEGLVASSMIPTLGILSMCD
ncbi:MAG: hypothetical protein ACKPKO_40325, partial [Candidatus Fonsibacter sp.]